MTTAERLQKEAQTNPGGLAKAFAATLKDFGYPVDAAYCKTQIEAWQRGEAPKGGPSMFIHGWLRDGMS